MNRIETLNNGGFPLTLDDHRFFESAIRDAFAGAHSAFSDLQPGNGFIISGCTWSSTAVGQPYTEGYLFIGGEIIKCDGGVFPTRPIGESYIWDIVETPDPTGLKTFRNQTTNQTYFTRRAVVISALVSSSLSYLPLNAVRLAKKIYDNINALNLFANKAQPSWQSVTLFDPGFSNYSGGRNVEFRKDDFGVVTIRGDLASSVVSSVTTSCFTLPAGFRPTAREVRSIAFYDLSSGAHYQPMEMQITTNGRVFPARTQGASPSTSTNWYASFEVSFNTN
jgi:hypothetical protein